jgi:hypothetical protein
MIINNKYGTRPILAHAPGKMEHIPLWRDVIDLCNYFPARQKVPKDLTIVTFNNGVVQGYNDKPMGLFESFIDGCCVLGAEVEEWKNNIKITLAKEFLKSVGTKFVLFCDSSDVFVVNRLDRLIVEFEKENCEACFNAEKKNWPHDLSKHIVDFENKIHPGMYLNAGVWMAYTDFAKIVLDACINANVNSEHHKDSEQIYYKFVYKELWPRIKVDEDCSIFQGLNRTESKELYFKKLI